MVSELRSSVKIRASLAKDPVQGCSSNKDKNQGILYSDLSVFFT